MKPKSPQKHHQRQKYKYSINNSIKLDISPQRQSISNYYMGVSYYSMFYDKYSGWKSAKNTVSANKNSIDHKKWLRQNHDICQNTKKMTKQTQKLHQLSFAQFGKKLRKNCQTLQQSPSSIAQNIQCAIMKKNRTQRNNGFDQIDQKSCIIHRKQNVNKPNINQTSKQVIIKDSESQDADTQSKTPFQKRKRVQGVKKHYRFFSSGGQPASSYCKRSRNEMFNNNKSEKRKTSCLQFNDLAIVKKISYYHKKENPQTISKSSMINQAHLRYTLDSAILGSEPNGYLKVQSNNNKDISQRQLTVDYNYCSQSLETKQYIPFINSQPSQQDIETKWKQLLKEKAIKQYDEQQISMFNSLPSQIINLPVNFKIEEERQEIKDISANKNVKKNHNFFFFAQKLQQCKRISVQENTQDEDQFEVIHKLKIKQTIPSAVKKGYQKTKRPVTCDQRSHNKKQRSQNNNKNKQGAHNNNHNQRVFRYTHSNAGYKNCLRTDFAVTDINNKGRTGTGRFKNIVQAANDGTVGQYREIVQLATQNKQKNMHIKLQEQKQKQKHRRRNKTEISPPKSEHINPWENQEDYAVIEVPSV